MKFLLTFGIYLGFCALLLAQKPRYNCYQKFMKEGRTAAENPLSFKLSLQKFNAARRCDPSKSDSVDIEIDKLFTQIIALKNKADTSEKKAKMTANELGKKNKEVEKTLVQVKQEQAKNKRIIDAFYFYGDSLALAVKQIEYDKYKYGFINKEGKVLINYEYDEAFSFNRYDGYARVKRDQGKYLLDTKGDIYPLTEKVEEITAATTALDLHNRQLNKVPLDVFQYPQLQILLLYQNQLDSLPSEVVKLTSLKTLGLGDNKNLSVLPLEIAKLTGLQTLDLRGTSLSRIPKEIGNLIKLQTLNLSSNRYLKELPKEIGNLTNLESLDLRNNSPLSSNRYLKELPKEIGLLTNLKSLYLSYNDGLIRIPKEIFNLLNLQTLDLRGTSLSRIPKEFGNLTKLQTLYLSSNRHLKELLKAIRNLTNLQTLNLSFNRQLNELPKEIGNLTHLQVLNLSSNYRLKELPKEIGNLIHLRTLNLRNCPISEAEKQKIKSWLPNCQIEF